MLPPRATLRGLCPNSQVDVFYTLMWDDDMSLPFYKGFINSNLRYNESLQSWVLTSEDGLVTGHAVSSIISMGTGAMTWQFDQDICSNKEPIKTVLTVCNLDQFTCESDGTCIAMEERCDQFPNCEDFSDESSCQLVVLPQTYVQDYAPFSVLESGLLNKVEVFIKVSKVTIHYPSYRLILD